MAGPQMGEVQKMEAYKSIPTKDKYNTGNLAIANKALTLFGLLHFSRCKTNRNMKGKAAHSIENLIMTRA